MSGDVPETAITAAEQFMMRRYPKWTPDSKGTGFTWSIFLEALAAAAPWIVAAERERMTAVIPPAYFRMLADWFDTDDEFKEAMFPETWSPGARQDDVQRDLRRFADLLDGAT